MESPTRFREVCIPKRTDGSGYAWLRARAGTVEYFGLDKHPFPPDGPGSLTEGGRYRTIKLSPMQMRGTTGYRIAYPNPDASRGYGLARFRLSHHHTLDTLLVLCRLLDQGPNPWLRLTDKNGGMLSREVYRSSRYLTAA